MPKKPFILPITLSAKPPIKFNIHPVIFEIPFQIPLIRLDPILAALSQPRIFFIVLKIDEPKFLTFPTILPNIDLIPLVIQLIKLLPILPPLIPSPIQVIRLLPNWVQLYKVNTLTIAIMI